jgi:uncharacterized membrane-anchored protein
MSWKTMVAPLFVLPLFASAAFAQEKGGDKPAEKEKWPPKIAGVTWSEGPATCKMRDLAEVKIPAGWTFTDGDGTRVLMRAMGNLTGTQEAGSVFPGSFDWFAVFEFDPCGYVKDEEKDDLDADEILEAKREGNKRGNEARKIAGLPPMEILGWDVKPHYDQATHNLEWSVRLKSEGETTETLNYDVRLLGRTGVMQVSLVAAPDRMAAAMPEFRRLLKDYAFISGRDYGSWRAGDKVAEYGLGALAAGGAVALAAKTGFLAKFWKFIVAGVIAAVAAVKRLFGGVKPVAKRPSSGSRPS